MGNFQNLLLEDFTSRAFREGFRRYFDELEIRVKDWEGLFQEMDGDGRDNRAFLRMDGERVVGFLQFCPVELEGWFFTQRLGFIREFWVAPEYRGRGHGAVLLKQAEDFFAARGIETVVLTTDSAEGFYKRHGYRHDSGFTAKNGDPVYIKNMLSERMDYHDKTL